MSKKLVRLWKRPTLDGQRYTYYLVYYDMDGRRRQKALGHADKRKAERQAAQLERELRMGTVEPETMSLRDMLQDYLEKTRTQIEPSTALSAVYRMKDFIDANGNIQADKVTYQHCEKFQQYSIDRGLSPASVNTHIKMVRRIFSLAVKRDQLEKNPFVGMPLIKVPRISVRLLNENEFQRVLNAADPLWMARILLAKTTGLHRGEILNLTINDVDFDKAKIIVQPKADTKHTWRWVVKDKERRELPLIDDVAELLVQIQIELPEGQPYLFLPPMRYRHLMELKRSGQLCDRVAKCPDGNHRRNWQVICKRAGVEDVTFHDLRATCITEWFEQGLMPHEVRQLAGHSSIETTMKYYVGYRESMIDRARAASSSALGGKSVANLLQVSETGPSDIKKALSKVMQLIDNANLKQIGATGLEPATS